MSNEKMPIELRFSDKTVPQLFEMYGNLISQRASLSKQMAHQQGKDAINTVINGIQGQFAKINGFFARHNETSTKRKDEVANFQQSLEALNAEYESKIQEISEQLTNLHKDRLATYAAIDTGRTAIKTLYKEGSRYQKPPIDPETNKPDFRKRGFDDLNRQKKIDREEQKIEKQEKTLAEIDAAIEAARNNLSDTILERNAKIAELSQTRELVKQNPFSRFIGLLGFGAASKEAALTQSIATRTENANQSRNALQASKENFSKDLRETNNELAGKVVDIIVDVEQSIADTAHDVTDFLKETGNQITNAGKRVLEVAGASLGLLGDGLKAGSQIAVGAIVKRS